MTKIIRIRLLFALLLSVFIHSATGAQQTTQTFIQETKYLLSLPENYTSDTSTKWPLLIFLHGSGEAGDNIEKVKAHGPPELAGKGKKFPFIVVSPQSDKSSGWNIEMLYKLLQDLKKKYRVNKDKVYLTGLSLGGFGTWEFAMKYPEELAAIAPVCGGGDTSTAWKLRHIAVWCFHGAKDDVVLPALDENMVNAARRYNPSVKFTLFPNANHNSWDDTYNKNDSLYDWLIKQSKFYYREKAIPFADLKKYEGLYYAGKDNDSVRIVVGEHGLIAKPGKDIIPLRSAGNDLFFIEPGVMVDLKFIQENKKITGFVFMGGDKKIYRRLE